MNGALRALLTGLVDYAGLFPPAALDMPAAVREYDRHLKGAHSWVLGRFVVPASRLAEFVGVAEDALPAGGAPWRLSVLLGADSRADLGAVAAFNAAHRSAVCDSVEAKAVDVDGVRGLAKALRGQPLATFVELPAQDDPHGLVGELAAGRLGAKIRTGGVTGDAFPTPARVIRFFVTCLRAGVPLKATAGLHHPLRGEYRLTYEDGSANATMYGFLNVFLAVALLRDGGGEDAALALLTESDPTALVFEGDTLMWRGHRFLPARLSQMRAAAAVSFGSCSFAEPVEDLIALEML